MYILVLIIFITIFYFIFKRSSSNKILSMSLWLYLAYGFLLITHFFSGIEYTFGDIYRVLPYFLGCIFLLLLGHRIGRTLQLKAINKNFHVKVKTLGFISVLGSIVFIYDIYRLNSINFGSRIEDLAVSPIGVLGNALSGFSLLVWLYSLYYYKVEKIKIPVIAYFSVLSYVAGGILSAGRQAIIILLISSLILLIWGSKKNKENLKNNPSLGVARNPKPWGFYILLSVFVGYFLFISQVRSGLSDLSAKISVYEKGFNSTTSDKTLNTANNLGGLSDIYIEGIYYYSHELIRLDLLYQYYDYPPIFGLFQMSYIERRLQWLVGKQGEASWEEVEFSLEEKGRFSSHTWSTFVGDYIVDFGRFGALIASFWTGYIAGIFYRRYKQNVCPKSIIRQTVICTGIVFSIQFSPVSELIYFIPLLFSSFLVLKPEPFGFKT